MITNRIENDAVYDQDICYAWNYLIISGKYTSLNKTISTKLLQLFNSLLSTISEELISMQIDIRSSVDLCRVHITLCLLSNKRIIKPKRALTYLGKIESILLERQGLYGGWRNISETAEIVGMLLDGYEYRTKFSDNIEIVNTLILKGVESIYSQFDADKSLWGNDIAATAKAMYAISKYDEIYDFTINDFFADFKKNTDTVIKAVNETGIDKLGHFYKEIVDLEKQNESQLKDIKLIQKGKKRLARRFTILGIIFTLIVILLFITGYIVVSLFLDNRILFDSITGNHKQLIFGGIVSSIVSIIMIASLRLIKTGFRRK